MKSLRWRLALWFGAGVVLVMIVFVAFTHSYLNAELRQKTWQQDYPDHPDWVLHGSYSEEEVRDILSELIETSLLYSVPLFVLAIVIGHLLARKSLQPITRLNSQLKRIEAPRLSERVELAEVDPDFQTLVHHINDLLIRLEKSFKGMSEYAAKVAHELRTPLAILRLKVEQAGNQISPELAEELENELHQLTHVVSQSLLMAKVGQGRLVADPRVFDLVTVMQESVSDFGLLAEEAGRSVQFRGCTPLPVRADLNHIRQIVHNLLTNALKHGQGRIRVRVFPQGERVILTFSNEVRSPRGPVPDAFGLGLRVVETLSSMQPNFRWRRRQMGSIYSVRLSFGHVQDPGGLAASGESLAQRGTLPDRNPISA